MSDHAALERLAVEVGLDADEVRDTLATDRFEAEVREDERTASALGISAVPCFVIDRRMGAPGAQPPEVLAGSCAAAGRRARRWRSSRAATPAAPTAAELSALSGDGAAGVGEPAEGRDHARVELRAGAALELLDRDLGAHRLAVAAVGGHRLEGVAHEHDPRGERDRLARELVGVAVAVHALVRRAHDRRHALERGRGLQDALADDRVAAHELPLGVVQRARLVEDRVGDGDLAHVVQLRRLAQVLELLGRQAEPLADREGELRHAVDVVAAARDGARTARAAARRWTGARPRRGRRSSAGTCARPRGGGRARRPRLPRAASPCRRSR